MQNPQIEFDIKLLAGPKIGQTHHVVMSLEDLEESVISDVLLDRDLLKTYCNTHEYEVVGRRVVNPDAPSFDALMKRFADLIKDSIRAQYDKRFAVNQTSGCVVDGIDKAATACANYILSTPA